MNDCSPQDMKKVWQDQELYSDCNSSDQICEKASRFQRRIWWRNLREYVAAGAAVTGFAFYIWKFSTPLLRIGSALTIIGVLYVVIHIRQRGSARTLPQDLGSTSCLDFHRRELERQRDLMQGIWSWYILPLLPGFVVSMIGQAIELGASWTRLLVVSSCAVVAWWVGRINKRGARKLQTQIDALTTLEKET